MSRRQAANTVALLFGLLLLIVGCVDNRLIALAPDQTATPTKTPRPTVTDTPLPTNTLPPTATPEATDTPFPTATAEPTETSEATETPEVTATPEATETAEVTETPEPTETPQPSPTVPPATAAPPPTNTVVPPTSTPPPTPTPSQPYSGSLVRWESNCGGTQVKGRVTDGVGNPVPGVAVEVLLFGEAYGAPPVTNGAGEYDFSRFGVADPIAPLEYTVAIIDPATGATLSNVISFTTGSENCDGPEGRQIATVNFVRN